MEIIGMYNGCNFMVVRYLVNLRKIMKPKLYIYSQPNYLTSRTAIETEILFAVWLSKKQALTGGKSLARENK